MDDANVGFCVQPNACQFHSFFLSTLNEHLVMYFTHTNRLPLPTFVYHARSLQNLAVDD